MKHYTKFKKKAIEFKLSDEDFTIRLSGSQIKKLLDEYGYDATRLEYNQMKELVENALQKLIDNSIVG